MSLLEQILTAKRKEIERLRSLSLPAPPRLRAVELARPAGAPLRLIAEIKLRSPSAGVLSRKLSVSERAAVYERAGATMVSVLCDAPFFDGAYSHLEQARASCRLPLLCKDFILDEIQLRAARAFGADAALLIVRCLDDEQLKALILAARNLGLAALVEVASELEADRALAAGAAWIGVNARDLDTLVMDKERARRVLRQLPASSVRVHLSGVSSREAVAELAAAPVDAALLGEVLMRQDDPHDLLKSFREQC